MKKPTYRAQAAGQGGLDHSLRSSRSRSLGLDARLNHSRSLDNRCAQRVHDRLGLVHDLRAAPYRGDGGRYDLRVDLGDLVGDGRSRSGGFGLGFGLEVGGCRGDGGTLGVLDSLSLNK